MFQGYKGDSNYQKELQIEVVFRINAKVLILDKIKGKYLMNINYNDFPVVLPALRAAWRYSELPLYILLKRVYSRPWDCRPDPGRPPYGL